MKKFKIFQAFAVAMVLAAALTGPLRVHAQESGPFSDLVLFGPASNPGGFVGFVQAFETNATEFFPAFLPAAANVPNNIGVLLYEDASQTVVSDQLWTQAGFWYFASDPNLINFASNNITTVGALVENGLQQDLSSFFLLPPGSMIVQSDIPEPASTLVAGLATGLWLLRRRRHARRSRASL